MLFAAFPFVFQRPPYLFTISQTGLTFISVGVGVAIGCATGIVIDRKIYMKHVYAAISEGKSHAAPEHRLYNAMYGSVGITIGLFWFAWTADNGVHWAAPVVAAVPFAWGNMCLFTSCALYMIDVYGPLNGSSAMAANGIFRYTLGAVFPLFTVQSKWSPVAHCTRVKLTWTSVFQTRHRLGYDPARLFVRPHAANPVRVL
jgi:hypothetical protein